MAKLRKNIFVTSSQGPFGLRDKQRRVSSFNRELSSLDHIETSLAVTNGYWFNRSGEYLGSGDLSYTDLIRIAEGLTPTQAFVILTEATATELLPKTHPEVNPQDGINLEIMKKYAHCIVLRNEVRVVNSYLCGGDFGPRPFEVLGFKSRFIGRKEIAPSIPSLR